MEGFIIAAIIFVIYFIVTGGFSSRFKPRTNKFGFQINETGFLPKNKHNINKYLELLDYLKYHEYQIDNMSDKDKEKFFEIKAYLLRNSYLLE